MAPAGSTLGGKWAVDRLRLGFRADNVLVGGRDLRARAVGYAFPHDAPDGFVRFRILEQLHGKAPDLILAGRLVETDDWNDKPAPYDFVRPTGRAGSCFTESYRSGAES
jgi:hypothetical protein